MSPPTTATVTTIVNTEIRKADGRHPLVFDPTRMNPMIDALEYPSDHLSSRIDTFFGFGGTRERRKSKLEPLEMPVHADLSGSTVPK